MRGWKRSWLPNPPFHDGLTRSEMACPSAGAKWLFQINSQLDASFLVFLSYNECSFKSWDVLHQCEYHEGHSPLLTLSGYQHEISLLGSGGGPPLGWLTIVWWSRDDNTEKPWSQCGHCLSRARFPDGEANNDQDRPSLLQKASSSHIIPLCRWCICCSVEQSWLRLVD